MLSVRKADLSEVYRDLDVLFLISGRSHSGRYSAWSEGKVASEAMKEFTEQGLSTGFDAETQGSRGIFDAFVGPNVPSGVGSSTTKFLAHLNYSKVISTNSIHSTGSMYGLPFISESFIIPSLRASFLSPSFI